MAEECLSTLLLMFIASRYFIYNTRRDTATKKELDIVIQMTPEYVLVQRFEKKKWTKKTTFNKTCKSYKVRKFLQNNNLVS